MSIRSEDQRSDTMILTELERIGEHIPGGFFVYRADESQEMLYVNRNVLRIFGCDTQEEYRELTGYTFRGMVHPEDFETIQNSIDEQIADSANDNLDYVEYRIVRKDGAIRWVDDYGHFARLAGYGDVYYVFISDITDKRHAQEEHFRAELQLEREKRAKEIKSGLLAGISHDIRTPMGAIAEFTKQAKSHLYEPHRLQGDLGNVEAAGQRLERLVDSLLDMSSAEFGRSDIHPEPCSLSAQLRDAMDLFRPRANGKNLTLAESFELPEEDVLADAQCFRTVMCNLISNAVSFTPENGSVTVGARRGQVSDSGYAQFEFTVSDTGVGMSEEFLQRVRESLEHDESTVKADGAGSGHGLSVASKLLRTMGGAMTIRSRERAGTIVTVNLPLQLAAHSRRVQFDSIFDLFSLFGGDPVYLYDLHTQTARFSPALLDVVGAPEEQLSGANGLYYWADYIHPDDRERFMRTIWEANELKQVSFDLRCRMRIRGVYCPVRILGGVTKDLDGRPDFLGLVLKSDGLSDRADPVTGLPNRRQFLLELQQPSSGTPARSVMLLRAGGLDRINEDFGRGRGNEVLRSAAQCIRQQVGDNGTVFRMEGAEFAVLSGHSDEAELTALYEALRGALAQTADAEGVSHRLIAFGALLLRSPEASLNDREVSDCLAAACAESELRRQGALVVLREGSVKDSGDQAVSREIRRCLAKDFERFFLLYQPIYDGGTLRPIGAEALLRWRDDRFGELTPVRFLADIEQEPGFRELGFWALRSVMTDGRLFVDADPDFTVCVNVSPQQVTDPYFAETLTALTKQTGFPPERLYLELNRSCRLLPSDVLRPFAAPLRSLGVRLGIDDFGSGSAWLEAVRELSADYVKFSNEFAQGAAEDETGRDTLRHLAELARSRRAEVFVKAVESDAAAAALQGLPIRGVQGLLYSGAVYYDDILDLLEIHQ